MANKSNMRNRRIQIMSGLYAMDLQKQNYQDALKAIEVDEYIVEVLKGIEEHLAEVDTLISSSLEGWTLARLNYVDRAILRLATYEMKFQELPAEVVINEAVELSKDYSELEDLKAHAFNNKVLDKIKTLLESE